LDSVHGSSTDLDGKIQQWYARADGRGVMFILNVTDTTAAKALMEVAGEHDRSHRHSVGSGGTDNGDFRPTVRYGC
jgi:hypothetical protein